LKTCELCEHSFDLNNGGCGYLGKYVCQNCLERLPNTVLDREFYNVREHHLAKWICKCGFPTNDYSVMVRHWNEEADKSIAKENKQ
jgi:hypothetical protein